MIKSFSLFLFLFTYFGAGYAQDRKYQDVLPIEAAQQLYPILKNARETKNPTIRELIELKHTTNLPEGFADTLYKYDWGKLRSYHFEDSPDDPMLAWVFANFEITRFIPKKPSENFDIVDNNGKLALTFINYANSKSIGVTKVGKYHYLVSEEDGKKTYAKIVQYQNGILIYDVSKIGSIKSYSSSTRVFRRVMVALPKTF